MAQLKASLRDVRALAPACTDLRAALDQAPRRSAAAVDSSAATVTLPFEEYLALSCAAAAYERVLNALLPQGPRSRGRR